MLAHLKIPPHISRWHCFVWCNFPWRRTSPALCLHTFNQITIRKPLCIGIAIFQIFLCSFPSFSSFEMRIMLTCRLFQFSSWIALSGHFLPGLCLLAIRLKTNLLTNFFLHIFCCGQICFVIMQSQKNPVSVSAMLTGKFLQIRKVFATSSLLD